MDIIDIFRGNLAPKKSPTIVIFRRNFLYGNKYIVLKWFIDPKRVFSKGALIQPTIFYPKYN